MLRRSSPRRRRPATLRSSRSHGRSARPARRARAPARADPARDAPGGGTTVRPRGQPPDDAHRRAGPGPRDDAPAAHRRAAGCRRRPVRRHRGPARHGRAGRSARDRGTGRPPAPHDRPRRAPGPALGPAAARPRRARPRLHAPCRAPRRRSPAPRSARSPAPPRRPAASSPAPPPRPARRPSAPPRRPAPRALGGGGGHAAAGGSGDTAHDELLRRLRDEQEQLGTLIQHPF